MSKVRMCKESIIEGALREIIEHYNLNGFYINQLMFCDECEEIYHECLCAQDATQDDD
jgi:predicted RNA-binding protein